MYINNESDNIELRPLNILSVFTKKYPDIWQHASKMYELKEELKWPDWCFMPFAGWLAIIGSYKKMPRMENIEETVAWISDVQLASALGAWRLGKGVYKFDRDLYDMLITTPINPDTPSSVFQNMPEYGIYIVTYDTAFGEIKLNGFFAYLEYDTNNKETELRLLLDLTDGKFQPVIIHIDERNVLESLKEIFGAYNNQMFPEISNLLSLVMYICSEEPEYEPIQEKETKLEKPSLAVPKIIKKEKKWIPEQKAKIWDIGVKTGTFIREYRRNENEKRYSDDYLLESEKQTRTVRPHIRKAHWQGYWTGKRDGSPRKYVLKWIHSLMINIDLKNVNTPENIREVKPF